MTMSAETGPENLVTPAGTALPSPSRPAGGRVRRTSCVADVAVPGVLVPADTSVLELDRYFRADPSLECVMILPERGPVLIDRRWFQGWITGPLGYGRAVNQRLKLHQLSPPGSIVLPAHHALEQAAAVVIDTHRTPADHVGVVWPDQRVGVIPVREIFRRLAERYAFQALHDPLTGLPNRAHLTERITHLTGRREDLTVLYVDLDGFKHVNDRFGHAAGDQVLVTFADRLRHAVRAGDLVVRLGGDEFAVLLVGSPSRARGEALAERVVRAAAAPFDVTVDRGAGPPQEARVTLGASVGVAHSGDPDVHAVPESLLKHADLAMYAAKSAGRGRFSLFDQDTSARG